MQSKFFSLLMQRPIKTSHTLIYCNPVSHTHCWAKACAVSVYIPLCYVIGIWHVASSAKSILNTHTQKVGAVSDREMHLHN